MIHEVNLSRKPLINILVISATTARTQVGSCVQLLWMLSLSKAQVWPTNKRLVPFVLIPLNLIALDSELL